MSENTKANLNSLLEKLHISKKAAILIVASLITLIAVIAVLILLLGGKGDDGEIDEGLKFTYEINDKGCTITSFADCDDIDVIIPETIDGATVVAIAGEACYGLPTIRTLTLPDTLESIGTEAFAYCTNLMSIKIGKGIKKIEIDAFLDCTKLVEVIDGSNLMLTPGSEKHGGVAKYAIEVHRDNSRIDRSDGLCFYTFKNTHYLIGYVGDDTRLILPESYKGSTYEILPYAFYCCPFYSLSIPSSIKYITKTMLSGIPALLSIEICGDKTTVADNAFAEYSNIAEVINHTSTKIARGSDDFGGIAKYALTVHSGTSRIIEKDGYIFCPSDDGEYYLVRYLSDENSPTLPKNIEGNGYNIYDSAFIGKFNLDEITIPEGVKSIGKYAFFTCMNLKTVILPESVEVIDDYAFASCCLLRSVTIREGVREIGTGAFYSVMLNSLELPKSLKKIGGSAFLLLNDIESISFNGTVDEWRAIEKTEDSTEFIDLEDSNWDSYSGIKYIICTDDTITKQ